MVGPTATGKSDLALALAEQAQAGGLSDGAEIINADASLLYRGMDIGTAKPSPAERVRVPHHQIDVLDARRPASPPTSVTRAPTWRPSRPAAPAP